MRDDDITTLDIAGLCQALMKRRHKRPIGFQRLGMEPPDCRHLPLLRPCRKRPRRGRAAEEGDDSRRPMLRRAAPERGDNRAV